MIHEHVIQFIRRNWTIRVWYDPSVPGIMLPSRTKVTGFADDHLGENLSKIEFAEIMIKMPGINRIEVTDYDGNGESLRK